MITIFGDTITIAITISDGGLKFRNSHCFVISRSWFLQDT